MRRRSLALLAVLPLVVSALLGSATSASAHPAHSPAPKKGEQVVWAYYVSDSGSALHVVAESRPVKRTRGVARASVAEMLRTPYHPQLVTLAPAGTRLLGVDLRKRVLVVDLSKQVRRNPGVGAAGEEAFAQQLAHTGAQFANVDAVQLRVEGKPVTELWGHRDWSSPVRPDMAVVAD